MNINAIRAQQRRERILKIIDTLQKSFSQNLPVFKFKLINQLCFELNTSRRTALEYLEVALSQISYKEIKLDGELCIVSPDFIVK